MIDVTALRVEREAVILERVDWRVEAGQHWVILGANGSGKTSLLNALAGYLPPTAGAVAVLGERYGRFDWRRLRERIGLVSSSLADMMPGGETTLNAVVSGRRAMIGLWGEPSAAERAEAFDILSRVEARSLSDRPWCYLAQGERQRVLIGRALMARAALLLLDEPCAGLDPVAREHFLEFLERLGHSAAAPTMVLVTHHVEEIAPVFSHVLVLRSGSVLKSGPADEVLDSKTLSEAFGAPLKLCRSGGRYSLALALAPAVRG